MTPIGQETGSQRARGLRRLVVMAFVVMLASPMLNVSVAVADPVAGRARIVRPSSNDTLTSGGSATEFGLKLPDGASCTRDSTHGGYRLHAYLVPESVALDTLKLDSAGPVPVPGQFRAPLYDDGGSQFINKLTADEVRPNGPGGVIQPVATFSFRVYTPTEEGFPLPPGSYNIGIACTLGPPSSASQLDRYWNAVVTVVTDPGDAPGRIRWETKAPIDDALPTGTKSRPSNLILVAGGGVAFVTVGLATRRWRHRLTPKPPRSPHEVQ